MKMNKAKLERAEAVLQKAERVLEDKARMSAGILWRQDVVAFRYVLDKLKQVVRVDLKGQS